MKNLLVVLAGLGLVFLVGCSGRLEQLSSSTPTTITQFNQTNGDLVQMSQKLVTYNASGQVLAENNSTLNFTMTDSIDPNYVGFKYIAGYVFGNPSPQNFTYLKMLSDGLYGKYTGGPDMRFIHLPVVVGDQYQVSGVCGSTLNAAAQVTVIGEENFNVLVNGNSIQTKATKVSVYCAYNNSQINMWLHADYGMPLYGLKMESLKNGLLELQMKFISSNQ